jgi:glycosyltransferase 2 family protein
MTPARKRLLTWVASLLLTAVLLYFFLRNAHLANVWEEAKEASPLWILAAIGGEAVSIFLRAVRWRVMLREVRPKIPLSSLLRATLVSFTISGLVPGRVGEVAKPYLLGRWERLPFGSLFASVVLERGMDLIAIFILWFVYIFFGASGLSEEAEAIMDIFTRLSYVFLGACIPVGIFLLWLMPRRRVLDRMAKRSERLSRYPLTQKVVRKFLGFAAGLGMFRKKRMILYVTLLSVAVWSWIAFSAWALVKALRLPIPWSASILLLMVVSFGAAIPTPGGVGGVHKAIQLALVVFYGLSEDTGVTAGILGHAVMFFPGIIWGLGYFALGRVHFKEIRTIGEEAPGPPGEEWRPR